MCVVWNEMMLRIVCDMEDVLLLVHLNDVSSDTTVFVI